PQLLLASPPSAGQLAANLSAFQAIKAYYANTPVPESVTDARAKGDFLANLKLQAQEFGSSIVSIPEIQQERFFIQQLGNGNAAVLGTSLGSQTNPFPLTVGLATPISGLSISPGGNPVL